MQKLRNIAEKCKEDLNTQGDRSYLWIGGLNIVKISILSNLTYTFNGIPIKTFANYFVDICTLIRKFI